MVFKLYLFWWCSNSWKSISHRWLYKRIIGITKKVPLWGGGGVQIPPSSFFPKSVTRGGEGYLGWYLVILQGMKFFVSTFLGCLNACEVCFFTRFWRFAPLKKAPKESFCINQYNKNKLFDLVASLSFILRLNQCLRIHKIEVFTNILNYYIYFWKTEAHFK